MGEATEIICTKAAYLFRMYKLSKPEKLPSSGSPFFIGTEQIGQLHLSHKSSLYNDNSQVRSHIVVVDFNHKNYKHTKFKYSKM